MDPDADIPIPLNSSYAGGHHGHIHHDPHHHIIIPAPASSLPPQTTHHHHMPANGNGGNGGGGDEHDPPQTAAHHDHKKAAAAATHHHHHVGVRYRECLKNHAAAMGGNATDGCGEFMPSGEEGSIEALTCCACNCHRNFHRKEIEGEPPLPYSDHNSFYQYRLGRSKVILAGHHHRSSMLPPPEAFGYPPIAAGTLIHSSRGGGGGGQMNIMSSYNMLQQQQQGPGGIMSESDDQEEANDHVVGRMGANEARKVKKRFRTKFTQEQKEKMFNFAERVGWKIQKQEEAVVQQLCQEIGVKRRVLKVWMHNNKHHLATHKNINNNPINHPPPATTTTTPAADHHHHHHGQLN